MANAATLPLASMWRLAVVLIALLSFAAHATSPPPPVRVFAAASLKESLDTIAADWQKRSGQQVVVSYAGSSALAKQIEQAAPADVFVSADEDWMDYLQQRRLVDPASRHALVGNRLVLIAPATSARASLPLEKSALRRALGDGRFAIAEAASVPAGRYTKQSLRKLGLWDVVADRLAQADNVRAAMAFVARGEAPLGVVYATDALAEPRVRVVARFPEASHDAIVYSVARLAAAEPAISQGFLDYLRGPDAAAVFKRAGFRQP